MSNTVQDLKNDMEETERLLEEDKKKYLIHLKKQSADIDEFFKKEESKTYFQKAVVEIGNGVDKIVQLPEQTENKPMVAPVLPKENKSILKKLWNNFKKIV